MLDYEVHCLDPARMVHSRVQLGGFVRNASEVGAFDKSWREDSTASVKVVK